MYARVLLSSIIFFLFTGCGEPEPDEFSQLRRDMQRKQDNTFGNSVKNLENRKNRDYVRPVSSINRLSEAEKALLAEEEAEKQRWLTAGISLEESKDWKALGLSPKHAKHWKKTGLSYNTISVLIKEDVLPTEAIAFMKKDFEKHPKAFSAFANPLYEFQSSCQKVLDVSDAHLEKINKKCKEYVQLLDHSAVSGYMADEYKDNDLSLEYISKLRAVDSKKTYLQKQMYMRSQLCLINGEKNNFALLFPILEVSPTKEEMFFIKQHKLALKDTQRYKSYEYYDFWVKKDADEERARLAAIKQEQRLKKAQIARKRAQAYRASAISYNKMVATECGEMVTSVPSTGEKVHIEGDVRYIVGKKGSNVFAYVVKNKSDNKSYLVRDPNTKKEVKLGTNVSWTALTVGRVVSVSLDDDGTASYNHYSDDDKEYYPMLKLVSKCPYYIKELVIR